MELALAAPEFGEVKDFGRKSIPWR